MAESKKKTPSKKVPAAKEEKAAVVEAEPVKEEKAPETIAEQPAPGEEKKEEDIAFIEAWVHEIKTPIAAIRLMIENALDHPTEHTLYDISDELMRIEDMVQKTICYSGLEDISKDCQIEKINLAKVVGRCMQREYANIHNNFIHIQFHYHFNHTMNNP